MPTVGNGDDIIGQSFTRGSANFQFLSLFTHVHVVCLFMPWILHSIFMVISSSFALQEGRQKEADGKKESEKRSKSTEPNNFDAYPNVQFQMCVQMYWCVPSPDYMVWHLFIAKHL